MGLVVEGASDRIYVAAVIAWLARLAKQVNSALLPCKLQQASGKHLSGYVKAIRILQHTGCGAVIVLRDSDFKNCGPEEKRRVAQHLRQKCPGINISVSVAEPEIEAWILADAECIHNACRSHYAPGATGWSDNATTRARRRDAKERLRHILAGSQKYAARFRTVPPTEIEMAEIFSAHFNIARAANFNPSALHFLCNLIRHLCPHNRQQAVCQKTVQIYNLHRNPVFRRWFNGGSVP